MTFLICLQDVLTLGSEGSCYDEVHPMPLPAPCLKEIPVPAEVFFVMFHMLYSHLQWIDKTTPFSQRYTCTQLLEKFRNIVIC